jgi:hypothetical protein
VTKVRSDSHGLYIRTGGYVFRPQLAIYSYLMNPDVKAGTTRYHEGDAVKAYHMSQTPHAKVKDVSGPHSEIWHSHGCYISNVAGVGCKTLSSEILWSPK